MMENFNIMLVQWKGGHKKNNMLGELPEKGWRGQFTDLREGGLAKTGQCTLCRLLVFGRLGFPTLHSLN